MRLDIHVVADPNRDDNNVIAESKGDDPNHVLVVDAQLDAICGAGMLDNASGSATILDIAEKMKNDNPHVASGPPARRHAVATELTRLVT
jgi:Zn-dependent M28 family amino/carboxypeptidase